jgi:hypothetical protein
MTAEEKTGMVLTIDAMATLIMLSLSPTLPSQSREHRSWLLLLLTIPLCAQLYHGSSWPRWLIGVFLTLTGLFFLYHLVLGLIASRLRFHPSLFYVTGLTIASLIVGPGLLFSPSVRLFLKRKRTRRSIWVGRLICVLWGIGILSLLVLTFRDIQRLL